MKPFWKSKTLWFNLIFLLVTLATSWGYTDWQPTTEMQQIITGVVLILNLILRYMTKQGIHF